MLTVAQPYFESDDFRGDMILYAAFPHPLLKRLVRFECGPDSLMRTDDCTDAFSRFTDYPSLSCMVTEVIDSPSAFRLVAQWAQKSS